MIDAARLPCVDCVDERGNVLGYWRCVELPVEGVHGGKWEYVDKTTNKDKV